MVWKAIDRYSKDYIELQTKDKVRFYKTPDAILQTQLEAYDAAAAKKSADNAMFKEIEASQRKFAERVVRWDLDTNVNRRMAYNHYFAKGPGAEEGLTRGSIRGTPSGTPGWCLFFRARQADAGRPGIDSDTDAEAPALRRQGEHLRRPRVLVAHRGAHAARSRGRCSPATCSTRRTRGRST